MEKYIFDREVGIKGVMWFVLVLFLDVAWGSKASSLINGLCLKSKIS